MWQNIDSKDGRTTKGFLLNQQTLINDTVAYFYDDN